MAKGQGRSSGQGVKLLYIRDYLYHYATKEHPKNANAICDYLLTKGIDASPKTIYNDILRLQIDFGVPVEYNASKWGYYITEPEFESYELRLVVDCVQAATFITQDEAQAITNKIKKLSNVYDRESLNRPSAVKNRIFRAEDSIVRKADVIHDAIAKKKKISFRYFRYIADRSTHKEYYDDIFIISPSRLLWDNGEYFVERYRNDDYWFPQFEVQRMTDVKILSIDINTTEDDSRERVKAEMSKWEDMLLGAERIITIRFRNNCARAVLEALGNETIIIPLDAHHFKITIKERCSTDFYAWLSQFGCAAKIISPQSAAEGFMEFLNEFMDLYTKDTEPLYVLSPEELEEL